MGKGTFKLTTRWLVLFSLAMGFLEAAVVVYLRVLYYPEGFEFPLVPIGVEVAKVELWRELATLVMLLAVGVMAGRNITTRWAYFLISFAIWDLAYYLFLKLFLGWPESWFTWDVLFLLPMTWVGPVLAPVLVACTMILLGLFIIRAHEIHETAKVGSRIWAILSAGVVLILVSFTWDYGVFVFQDHGIRALWSFSLDEDLFTSVSNYVPTSYPWGIFFAGEVLLLFGCFLYARTYFSFSLKPAR